MDGHMTWKQKPAFWENKRGNWDGDEGQQSIGDFVHVLINISMKMAMYKTPCVFEERAQHLEALVPLSEDQIQFQVPTSSGFQLPITPSP